jgi:hypothetical protein
MNALFSRLRHGKGVLRSVAAIGICEDVMSVEAAASLLRRAGKVFECLVGLCVVACIPANAETQLELFKHFVESPPRIKDLVYSQEIAGLVTNYHRIKWQENALWFGRSDSNLLTRPDFNDVSLYTLIVARFEDKKFVYNGSALYSWTNFNGLDTNYNSVTTTFDHVLNGQIADILNMGCQLAAVGSIEWRSNSFEVENQEKAILIKGSLESDLNSCRASKLVVEQYSLGDKRSKLERPAWSYEYKYETTPLLGYLPSEIVASFKESDGSLGMSINYRIGMIELSDEKLDESDFVLNYQLFPTSTIPIMITNGTLVYSAGGRVVVATEVKPATNPLTASQRKSIRYAVLGAFGLLCVIPLLFVWLNSRMRINHKNER